MALTEAAATVLAGGIGAAGGITTGAISGGRTKRSQERAMAYNAREANLARDFQREMYRSRYQMTVSDMKAAGLNPLMMYGGGSSATSVGGSTSASVSPTSADMSSISQGISSAVQSALARKKLQIEKELAEKQKVLTDELAKTEVTKQVKNISDSSSYIGRINTEIEQLRYLIQNNSNLPAKAKRMLKSIERKMSNIDEYIGGRIKETDGKIGNEDWKNPKK